VNSAVADISDVQEQIFHEFVLDGEVPLLHVPGFLVRLLILVATVVGSICPGSSTLPEYRSATGTTRWCCIEFRSPRWWNWN